MGLGAGPQAAMDATVERPLLAPAAGAVPPKHEQGAWAGAGRGGGHHQPARLCVCALSIAAPPAR